MVTATDSSTIGEVKLSRQSKQILAETLDGIGRSQKRIKTIDKRRQQFHRIAEVCCDHDYDSETNGYRSTGTAESKKIRPYRSPEHHIDMVRRSQTQVADCEVSRDCLEKLVSLLMGECPAFALNTHGNPTDEQQAELDACEFQVERVSADNHPLVQIRNEFVTRLLRDGEVFWAVDLSGDEPDVLFLETCWICKPDVTDSTGTYNEEFWGYGVVAEKSKTRKPLGYWVEGYAGAELSDGTAIDTQESLGLKKPSKKYGFVSSGIIRHVKIGCDSTDPRGVPRAPNTLCWSVARKQSLNDAIDYVGEQAKHAVVRKLSDQVDVVSGLGLKDIADAQKLLGVEPWDGPGETTIKGEDLMVENIGSIQSIILLSTTLHAEITTAWGFPRFMIDGDAGSGNRANMGAMADAFYRILNSTRKLLQPHFVEMAWAYLSGICNRTNIEQNATLAIDWPPLTSEMASKERTEDRTDVQQGLKSPQAYIRKHGCETPEDTIEEITAFASGETGVPDLPEGFEDEET